MMRKLRFLAVNIAYTLMGVSVAISAAQPATCAPLVIEALNAVDSNCSNLGRNTVCYGYNRVDATFFDAVSENTFSAPADRAGLQEIAAVQTAPLDVANNLWGVAMMNVQANIPNSLPGQAVTFILLGDTRVENAVLPDEAFVVGDPVRVVITSGARINVRSGPGTNFNVVANADPGQLFDVDARNEAGDWYRLSGVAPYQWINRSLFSLQSGGESQLRALPVAQDVAQSPMQAFYFRTGIGVPTCEEAPDMLLIQGPKDIRVSLTVNGAEVALGSTIAFQSNESRLDSVKANSYFSGAVSDLDLPDEAPCLVTRLTVLEGDALTPDGNFIPLGHKSSSVTCLDMTRAPVFAATFGQAEELSDEELESFAFVESVPLPHYPVELPTREQIRESVANGPDVKPEPTRLPRIQLAQPTPRPTTSGGTQPPQTRVTETPAPEDRNTPSCEGFSIVGPGSTINAHGERFTWTFARNVVGYQLEINGYYDSVSYGAPKLFRVGGETNVISVSTMNEYSDIVNRIVWKVQVLVYNEQGVLTTLCESDYRESLVNF